MKWYYFGNKRTITSVHVCVCDEKLRRLAVPLSRGHNLRTSYHGLQKLHEQSYRQSHQNHTMYPQKILSQPLHKIDQASAAALRSVHHVLTTAI